MGGLLTVNGIYTGDALELMDRLEPSSIDLALTDPPYFLDKLDNGWDPAEVHRTTKSQVVKHLPAGMRFDPEQGRNLQKWYTAVSEKVYRALKPGGFYLSFSSPRLAHRMAVAVEDAGFHVRDVFIWLYKEGRAKGFSLVHFAQKRGQALPKEWRTPQVRGNYEPIIVAQKPPEGTLLDNFLVHGTGLFDFSARTEKGLTPSNVLQVEEIEGIPPFSWFLSLQKSNERATTTRRSSPSNSCATSSGSPLGKGRWSSIPSSVAGPQPSPPS